MNIKFGDFKIGYVVEFIKQYNAQHPIEYYAYVPLIPKGTRGIVTKISKDAISVKVEGIDNLVTLWDNETSPGSVQDKIDCVKILKKE